MKPEAQFLPAWWLPGPHLQTIWGRAARGRSLIAFRREVLETPDGDELVLDHLEGEASAPRVLLLHGLEGSSNSVYIQGFLQQAARRGWRATAMNFRSCARDPKDLDRMLPNRRPRLYHSGETSDLDFVVRALSRREPAGVLGAIGVSLGGNVLLKWLGENPGQKAVAAAAAVSTPYDLGASGRFLETTLGRLYVGNFLATLKTKAVETARRFPEAAVKMDIPGALRARTFWEFDDAANAPLHGFTGADDYYRRASSIGFVSRVTTRALCLSAEDDPFLPPEALARTRAAASPAIDFRVTRHGGHIGFVAGASPWRPRYWAEEYVLSWLEEALPAAGR